MTEYSKKYCMEKIRDNLSTHSEGSLAKNLPIDMLHDFKKHFRGMFRIRYRGGSNRAMGYRRSPYHCIQRFATSFAIYPTDDGRYLELFR